ncbi:hypothetical protein CLV78_12028 [Aliiruegeria haliotis]|uniref:Uncharacterized protein n=2 Tax=Aliiruegeria haliotis TaxID=1280846 RepID=A0A2T0REN4_9RHOB|nr:hypothetical protein CLV78_12028 [Aliiruegeria haliotis]
MDGFHLDNRILVSRGLLDRKGAPETFDVRGVNRLVEALAEGGEVYYPLFDRAQDIAIAGAGVVLAECETVVVEGNYLLHDAEDRRDLVKWWDVSIRLVVPEPELEQRLMERWLAHGLTRGQARNRARRKDITNARLVTQTALEADVLVRL